MEARSSFALSPRNQVHRTPARASYDQARAYAILDEALVAAVGFAEGDQPYVIPMVFARLDDRLVLHAASKSRFALRLAAGAELCVTVTLVDGLVLARSAMHHSMNYRSVVAFGRAVELAEEREKLRALTRLVDHVLEGRSLACRPPNALELKATRVFALPLEDVSVKQRQGGPLDDAEDLELPYWAGVVPMTQRAGAPVADAAHVPLGAEPAGLQAYERARPGENQPAQSPPVGYEVIP
jgi:nitroimidazol reductase NimA-like FMN-containing flavoprotein (pyridoxamine 5'-phosphate oxidase superfamily)